MACTLLECTPEEMGSLPTREFYCTVIIGLCSLCALDAARVHFNCTTPCRVTVNTNAERCREVRGTRPRDSLDWEDALQRALGM